MAISSVVVVADNQGIDTAGIEVPFTPGDSYPISGVLRLFVREQPFPPSGQPTWVVPSIVEMRIRYGRFGQGQDPPPFEPEEHSFRELWFSAYYKQGSWQVTGDDEAQLLVDVRGGLRDNTPSGDTEPDDPFSAYLNVQALCVWTTEVTLLDQLVRELGNIRSVFRGQ